MTLIENLYEAVIQADEDLPSEYRSAHFKEAFKTAVADYKRFRKEGLCVYVVQREEGGIPDDPVIFLNEEKADEYFLQKVNTAYEQNFTYVEAAQHYVMKFASADEAIFRYWVCRAE